MLSVPLTTEQHKDIIEWIESQPHIMPSQRNKDRLTSSLLWKDGQISFVLSSSVQGFSISIKSNPTIEALLRVIKDGDSDGESL